MNAKDSTNESKKPEIIYAWDYLEWGGVQILFLGIMRLAVAKGYKVTALMPVGTSEDLISYLKVENVVVEFFDAKIDLSKAKSFLHKIRRRLNDWNCNLILARNLARRDLSDKIVHIDAAPWSAFALLFYIALKTNVFITLHIAQPTAPTLRNLWIKFKYRLLYMLPKFHLLASNREMHENLKWFATPEKWREVAFVHSGINTEEISTTLNTEFDRSGLKRKHGLPIDKKIVLALGNIVERKGFRVFTEAARMLQKDAPELVFVWVGDGEKRG
ncbi:MAG: glycosyltransferase family 4 protein, partial [Pyrinomonadaceae bacterium]|nr:glycosyltransferase family 4 protein [Pyrinomonadaceae bacterium]